MTREEAIFCEKSYIGETNCTDCKYYGTDTCQSRESHRMAIQALEQTRWIPITTRPMTDEEKENHRELLEYVDDAVIFNCPLPDDGQEVLITVYGETELDTFYNDSIDGCYFENRDIEDVRAWMPLPPSYDPQESEDKNVVM